MTSLSLFQNIFVKYVFVLVRKFSSNGHCHFALNDNEKFNQFWCFYGPASVSSMIFGFFFRFSTSIQFEMSFYHPSTISYLCMFNYNKNCNFISAKYSAGFNLLQEKSHFQWIIIKYRK